MNLYLCNRRFEQMYQFMLDHEDYSALHFLFLYEISTGILCMQTRDSIAFVISVVLGGSYFF